MLEFLWILTHKNEAHSVYKTQQLGILSQSNYQYLLGQLLSESTVRKITHRNGEGQEQTNRLNQMTIFVLLMKSLFNQKMKTS